MKSIKTSIIKFERNIFSEQICQGFSNFRKIFNKAIIKPGMTKKTPYPIDGSGWWKSFNYFVLSFVHFNSILGHALLEISDLVMKFRNENYPFLIRNGFETKYK